MAKKFIKQKLAEVIKNLNSIISSEGEKANGSPNLLECRNDLSEILKKLNQKESAVDVSKILIAVYKAIDLIHMWTHMGTK